MNATGELTAAAGLRLLSLGFTAPDAAGIEQLRRLTVLCARHADEEGLAEILAALEGELDDDEILGAMQVEYEALFGGTVRISPYESAYEVDPFRQARQMADIEGFYRAFGAASAGPAAERADHVGAELEFASLLLAKQLEATESGNAGQAAVCEEACDDFMREHLGRWFPAFCREVAAEAGLVVYRLLALAGERLVVAHLARRGIEPASLPLHRRPATVVEGDELTCGGDGAAAV